MLDQQYTITSMKTQSPMNDNIGFQKVTTEEQAFAAVKKDYRAISYIPKNFITQELCFYAVRNDGHALEHVPKKLITEELCLEAVKQDGWALTVVPKKLKTTEVCHAAVQHYGWALKSVSNKLKTMEICLAAVQNEGFALEYVPEEFRTTELCISAIYNYIFSMKYVPEKSQTKELISALIKKLEADHFILSQHKAGEILSYISKKFRSEVKERIIDIYGIDVGDINYWLAYCMRLLVETEYPKHLLIDHFNIPIRLFPKSPELYTARACAYKLLNEKKAQADFKKARELERKGDGKARKLGKVK